MSLSYMFNLVTRSNTILLNTTNALNKTINEVITKQIKLIQNSKKGFLRMCYIQVFTKFLATVYEINNTHIQKKRLCVGIISSYKQGQEKINLQ